MVKIEVKELHKMFDDKHVLKGISFTLEGPGVYGLFGPNGAGKTTLIRCVTGVFAPSSGEVYVEGNLSYMPEKNLVWKFMKARTNIKVFREMFDGKGDLSKVFEVARYLGMEDELDRLAGRLSKGTQRKLTFLMSLAMGGDIFILDEPLSGLDVIARKRMREVIAQLADEGKMVIISTHELREMDGLVKKAVFIKGGKILDVKEKGEMSWEEAFLALVE